MKDGVYLGLPHSEYLAAPDRLGSTDLVKLFARGAGWWWGSRYNPHHVEKATDAQVFGTALHALLLEGRAAYERGFAVKPNPRDYPNLLRTAEEIRSALEAAAVPGIKANMRKDDLVNQAKAHLAGRHIWDDIVERWSRTARDKLHLESGEAFALEAMTAAAMQDPQTRTILHPPGEVPLIEVSVFYTDARGLQKRFRFDSLVPDANVDLKSVADWKARPFAETCAARIGDDHLNVQLAMSHEARLAMYELIAADRIQIAGPTESPGEKVRWLQRFPAERPLNLNGKPGWCWCWLFYQKPESGAAPSLLPVIVGYGETLHVAGWRKMRLAENCYLENVKRFGLNKPWTQVQGVMLTHPSTAQPLQVHDWNAPQSAVAGEAEAMTWQR